MLMKILKHTYHKKTSIPKGPSSSVY